MSDITKVVEEEFDDEGNLTRRITTEYGPEPVGVIKRGYDTGIKVGTWPYADDLGSLTSIISTEKYQSYNGDHIQYSGLGHGEGLKVEGCSFNTRECSDHGYVSSKTALSSGTVVKCLKCGGEPGVTGPQTVYGCLITNGGLVE